jgi:putative SOS response-associated peptidase YedK
MCAMGRRKDVRGGKARRCARWEGAKKGAEMCGRYQIEVSDDALREICEEIQRKQRERPVVEQLVIKFDGEVFPTDIVPVTVGAAQHEPMRWGFSGFNNRPIINARSETALAKPTFKQSMLERRCLVPASAYYEWMSEGGRKIKHRIYDAAGPLFFAGCYRQEPGEQIFRFVILTREASPKIRHIHDRMPVIVAPSSREDWLGSSDVAAVLEGSCRDLLYQPCDTAHAQGVLNLCGPGQGDAR